MRHSLLAITALAVAFGGTACATKGYVNTQVSQVNGRVDSMGESLEETQERTRDNADRITDVDGKAAAAQGSADEANSAAMAADERAGTAADAARMANEKAESVDAASRKIVYEVVLSEDTGNFKFNDSELPEGAAEAIDEMIGELMANPQAVWFEIEGHTDNSGPAVVNERIGLERAEAVKKYLYEHHQIPLHKMNVISYGEDKPAAENNTRDGRAQNRRVVIRVLG